MSDSEITTIDDVVETKPKKKAEVKTDGRRTLTIHAGDGEGGTADVFIGVNGYAYNIKRGKPVQVPPEVIEALSNAKVTRYAAKDGNTEAIEVPRYAFTVS
jgi:hypothetical protein